MEERNNEKRKKLEGMLRAVQDIKSQFYIGTQEAWDMIKSSQVAYSRPQKIANKINERLGLKETDYLATPERLSGIIETLDDTIDESHNMEDEDKLLNFVSNLDICSPDLVSECSDIRVGLFQNVNVDWISEKKLIDYLSKTIADINTFGIKKDSDLGEFFPPYVSGMFDRQKEELPKFGSEIESLKRKTYEKLSKIDWENSLSKKSFRSIQRSIANFSPCSNDIYEKLLRDQLDNRLEYQRQLLSEYLRNEMKLENGTISHSIIVTDLERRMNRRKDRLEKLISQNAPKLIINNERKQIEYNKFIRHLLGSEKNFVKRFIKS